MHDASAVIIQPLDIVTERMIYSSHGDVNDFSVSFSMYVPYLRMVALSHGKAVRKPYELKALAIETRA
jgi:hypothetical protein